MSCARQEQCQHGDGCFVASDYNVKRCTAFKSKMQTNEEWIKQCTTEQLADVFFDYRYINATPQQQLWLSANEDFVKGGIVEWLKLSHND